MAVSEERLVAVLEAKIAGFEKEMKRAGMVADQSLGAIETRGAAMAANLNKATMAGTTGFAKMSKAAQATKVQTGQLAAQFNDIAVQLAGGQSPMLIALQQGSQITQAFGNAGVKGAIMGVGSALFSMVNPLSLVTLGIIAAGGAALQYFMSMGEGAAKTEEELKRQRDLIGQVAEKWGDALPALKAYNDALNAAQAAADIQTATDAAVSGTWEKARTAISQAENELLNVRAVMENLGQSQAAADLADDFAALQSKVEAGNATAEDAKVVHEQLAATFNSTGVVAVGNMANAVAGLYDILTAASAATVKLNADTAALQKNQALAAGLKASTLPTLDPLNFIDPQRDMNNVANATQSQTQAAIAAASRSSSSGAKSDPYGDEIKSIQERTAALNAETAAQASINPLVNDYGFAIEKARIEQDILTSAEKAHVAVTDEVKAKIDLIATGYANATVAAKKLAEEQKNIQETMTFAKDTVNGFLSDLRAGLEDGKLTWQDFGNAALNVLNKIADRIQTQLVDALFNLGTGTAGAPGILGALFGGAATGAGGIPAHAAGTSFAPGGLTMVGEKGPELVRMPRGSKVIPNHRLGGGGGSTFNSTMHITVDGNGDRDLMQKIEIAGRKAMRTELTKFSANHLPKRVREIASDPRKVG